MSVGSESRTERRSDSLLRTLREDLRAAQDRDPAARSMVEVALAYPGVHALWIHRVSHRLWTSGGVARMPARLLSQFARFLTGIEIHPGAKIGRRMFIDHGMGVVIGETAEIGEDVLLYQGVVLGGTTLEKKKRHPTLGNNVLIGAGAKILGPFKVGDYAMIGANSVVLHEVPAEATVVGVPGRVIKHEGRPIRHNVELDHDSAPDPIEQEICQLRRRMATLEAMFQTDVNCQEAPEEPGQQEETSIK